MKKSTEKFEVVKHRRYSKPRSIENEQQSAKTDVRLCIQMAMLRRQKTHLTATLQAHRKRHLVIHQSKFDQSIVK